MPNAAYKIESDYIKDFLNINPGSEVTGDLFGLIFKLIKEVEPQEPALGITSSIPLPVPILNLHKVYFDESLVTIPGGGTQGTNPFSTWPPLNPIVPSNGPINPQKLYVRTEIGRNDSSLYSIQENISSDIITHQLSSTPFDLSPLFLYGAMLLDYGSSELDFYDSSIEYVYFSYSQLRPILDYFGELIISGASIQFGKKLSSLQDADEDEIYPQSVFTLKVEGQIPDGNITDDGTELPSVILGVSCPPKWYIYKYLLDEIQSDYPDLEISYVQIKKSWSKVFGVIKPQR